MHLNLSFELIQMTQSKVRTMETPICHIYPLGGIQSIFACGRQVEDPINLCDIVLMEMEAPTFKCTFKVGSR